MTTFNPKEVELERRLELAHAELDSFTYSVSHDLKSPLHTILGFVDLVLEDLAAGRQQTIVEDLQRVKEASLTMQGQLEAILEFSRMGRASHEPADIPVETVWETLRRRWDPVVAGVGGRLELGGSAAVVHADPGKLSALLDHLMDNAVRFRSPVQELCVHVRFDKEGDQVRGMVKDNGLGVDPSQVERIFDMFRKVSQDGPGMGVGLALARKLVVLHDGSIRASSEGLGQGLEIHFVLPTLNACPSIEAHGQA